MLQVYILRESSCPEERKYNFISLGNPKRKGISLGQENVVGKVNLEGKMKLFS